MLYDSIGILNKKKNVKMLEIFFCNSYLVKRVLMGNKLYFRNILFYLLEKFIFI